MSQLRSNVLTFINTRLFVWILSLLTSGASVDLKEDWKHRVALFHQKHGKEFEEDLK